MKNWKQPIPTDLERYFGEDYAAIALFKEIIYRACNDDGMPWEFSGRIVILNRGQTVFGGNQFAKYMQWTRSKIERVLARILQISDIKPDIKLRIQRTKSYSIITIENYNSLTGMSIKSSIKPDMKRTSGSTSTGHEADTSKSVESVESVESGGGKGPVSPMSPDSVTKEFLDAMKIRFPTIPVDREWDKALDYLNDTGFKDGKGRQRKDIPAFFRNWLRRAEETVQSKPAERRSTRFEGR